MPGRCQGRWEPGLPSGLCSRAIVTSPAGLQGPTPPAQEPRASLGCNPLDEGPPGEWRRRGSPRPSGGAAVPSRLRGWGALGQDWQAGRTQSPLHPGRLCFWKSLFPETQARGDGRGLGTHQDPKWSGLAPLPGSHLGSPGRWVARWLRVPDTQRDGRPGPQGPTGAAPCRARETSPFRASSEEAPGGRGLSGHWGAEWPGPARTPVCSSPGKAGDWAGPEQAEGRHEQPGRPSWEQGATPPGGCGRL